MMTLCFRAISLQGVGVVLTTPGGGPREEDWRLAGGGQREGPRALGPRRALGPADARAVPSGPRPATPSDRGNRPARCTLCGSLGHVLILAVHASSPLEC